MDSSGIYSDLDKRQDSVGLDGESYGDGDHTTDTGDTEVSMRSQLSPDKPMPALVTKNFLSPQVILNETNEINSTTSSMAEVTVIKCQKNEQNTATKSKSNINNKENSAPLKKHKMPKRNVSSKIKTMLESNQNIVKEEPESEPRRCQRQQRKTGRWDAVMNKIEAGKTRGRALKKEVKSRVLEGLGTSTSSTASTSSSRRAAGDANNNANKDKRRARGRPEPTSPNQETARSSVRSSASDLSSAHSKEALKRPSRNNNQLNSNLHKSNLASVRKSPSIKSVQSNVNAKQKNATTNKVADRNASNIRAIPAPGKELPASTNGLNNHLHNHVNNNNNNNNHVGALSEVPVAAILAPKPETREQEVQAVVEELPVDAPDSAWSKRAEDTVQALAITVQYLTHQLEKASDCRLRKDLEKMKSEWLSAHSKLEELRLRKASIEDALSTEREARFQTLQSLRDELEHELSQRSVLEQSLVEERSRADSLQESLAERQREQRAALERLASEHKAALGEARLAAAGPQVSAPPDQGALLAEVESLRTVLELRSRESGHLRCEVDLLRRELDEKELLKQRCESLEARCEDLKAQLQSKETYERQLAHDNEVLMGSLHQISKQNKRLSQRNEELLWRLRQKNEVVSVLTNQLTPQSQRLSKSLGPEQTDHPSGDPNCTPKSDAQSCSMVKYMVEKGDSVSWTLDITESADSSSNCTKSPSTRRYHENNGSFVSRQGSLRLSTPRRPAGALSRARSNSVSVAESAARTEEPVWSPTFNSTPLQRRRNVTSTEQNWSLSNSVVETMSTSSSCSSGGNVGCNNATACAKVLAVDVSTTDDDEEEEEEEEEALGQRPQEAGGEAMISEETSASSSSEDESSVSSSDIP